MISCDSNNNCPSTNNNTSLCIALLPDSNNGNCGKTKNRFGQRAGTYRSSSCYRPLQQLYKTVYSPMCANSSSRINFACICRPAERYKTTNMTYGSFHYNNWAFVQKNRPIAYDREFFVQCYENKRKQQQMNRQEKCNNRITNGYDSNEKQYWTQPTCNSCCPTDCCNNVTLNLPNC